MADNVNHPPHYTAHASGHEAVDICEHMNFNLGNAVKYLWRHSHKGAPKEDLKKCAWYLRRERERLMKRGLLRTLVDWIRQRHLDPVVLSAIEDVYRVDPGILGQVLMHLAEMPPAIEGALELVEEFIRMREQSEKTATEETVN